MSTTFEWRDAGERGRRETVGGGAQRRTGGRGMPERAALSERAATPSKASAQEPIPLRRPAGERRGGAASRAVAVRLRQRLDRARLVAAAIIGLSVLGLIYVTQISHVARYGYLLSDLQRQQDRVGRENQLLEYEIAGKRSLTEAEDLAVSSYGMKPIVQLTPSASGGMAMRGGAQGTPGARYITVQRPPATAPAPQPTPAHVGMIDRLLNQLVGIGEASAER
jgi:hypothetical protein